MNIAHVILFALLALTASTLSAQVGSITVQDVEPNMTYRAIHAADSNHCIAIGAVDKGMTIKRTSDGGKTWLTFIDTSRQYRASNIEARELAYPTPNTSIIVGDSGLILRSSDGGDSWRQIPSGVTYPLRHIAMCDSLHGIITIGTKDPLATTDGGLTWERIPAPPIVPDHSFLPIADVAYLTPADIIFLRIAYSTFFTSRTSDGGKTWVTTSCDSISRIVFVDPQHGWGCGRGLIGNNEYARDIIRRTTDSAQNWEIVLDSLQDPAYGLLDIAFADTRHGLAIDNGKFWRTDNGGQTWTLLSKELKLDPNVDPFIRIAYPSGSRAWIIAPALGKLYCYNAPTTSDVPMTDKRSTMSLQVTPNPISRFAVIHYSLENADLANLVIVDELGRVVNTIAQGAQAAGEHQVQFDAGGLPPGTFFVRLSCAGQTISSAIAVVRY